MLGTMMSVEMLFMKILFMKSWVVHMLFVMMLFGNLMLRELLLRKMVVIVIRSWRSIISPFVALVALGIALVFAL